jgi:hypothetical protein
MEDETPRGGINIIPQAEEDRVSAGFPVSSRSKVDIAAYDLN